MPSPSRCDLRGIFVLAAFGMCGVVAAAAINRAGAGQPSAGLMSVADEDTPASKSTPVFNNKTLKDRKKKVDPPAPGVKPADAADTKPADSPGSAPLSKSKRPPAEPKGAASPASGGKDVKKSGTADAAKGNIPMIPAEGPPDEVWNDYFSHNKPDSVAVHNVVIRLTEAKKYEHVIALIQAALIQGQAQPWMYEVLGISMEVAGRPKQDIERALLSAIDFTAVNVPNRLYSAAFLARLGLNERALELYRQASSLDPTNPIPYMLGLRLARQLKDADGVQWAAAGIVMRAWTKDHEALHKEAEQAALDTEGELRKKGDFSGAERLAAAMVEARQRDLVVELTWSGAADIDLLVEDPLGSVCSFENPLTPGGGVLVHDGFGPDQKNTFEKYVCPEGMPGDYRVTIRYVWGDVVGKRAVLKLTRYLGTPREQVETRVVELTGRDKVIRLTLNKGRLKAPVPVPAPPREQALNSRPARRAEVLRLIPPESAESRRTRAEFNASRQKKVLSGLIPAPVGFQPIITVLPEGVSSVAQAVVSADRRYVRLSLSPSFSAISSVFTFSFGGGGNQGQPGAGGGAIGGGAARGGQNQGQPQN